MVTGKQLHPIKQLLIKLYKIMFIAKFTQTTNDDYFNSNRHGVLPFIGEVFAGTSLGSIIDGTMFQRDGLNPHAMYACENYVDIDYPDNQKVRVLSEVSSLEYISLKPVLGEPKTPYSTKKEKEDEILEPIKKGAKKGKATKE